MYSIYKIKGDWYAEGEFVSSHETLEQAEKQIPLVVGRTPYYIRITHLSPSEKVYDYGDYTKFIKIKEIK